MKKNKKIIKIGSECLNLFHSGIDKVVDLVKITLGPKGKYVAIDGEMSTSIINDGSAILKEVCLDDPIENLSAKIVIEASHSVNEEVGDGTTSVTILIQSMFKEALKLISSGIDPVVISKGIKKTLPIIVQEIKNMSVTVTNKNDIINIASISSGSYEIGKLINNAIEIVGKDGAISVETAKSLKTELIISEGLEIDEGVVSPFMILDNEREETILENPLIFITDKKNISGKEVIKLLETMAESNKSLLIISPSISSDAINAMIFNRISGPRIASFAVKAPGFDTEQKAILKDLSIMLGIKFFSSEITSFDELLKQKLGTCNKVIIKGTNKTIFIGCSHMNIEALKLRKANLSLKLKDRSLSSFEKEKIGKRISGLNGKVVVIRVGASSEVETKEQQFRIEDSINATKALFEEGYVDGAGIALINVFKKLKNFKFNSDMDYGRKILFKSILSPAKQILINAGENSDVILDKIINSKSKIGYHLESKSYVNLMEKGIIDATKVIRIIVEKASSTVATLILTNGIIVNKEEDNSNNSYNKNLF